MNKKYELVVKGINNHPDKIVVTVALEIAGQPSLLSPQVSIGLDRTEGAPLEFYEAEAKKQAKKFFMDIAVGLCEGDEPLPEKHPIILEAQDVLITYRGKLPGIITGSLKMPPSILRSEKDDVESRIEKLERYIAELKKSTPTKNEVLAADEMKEAILDRAAHLSCASRLEESCLQSECSIDEKNAVMSSSRRFTMIASKLLAGPLRRFCRKSFYRPHRQKSTPLRLKVPERKAINVILLRLHRIKDKAQEPRRPFRVSCEEGEFVVYENGKPVRALHHHCQKIIDLAIGCVKDENTSVMKRIGRCMGYLQVAAEIEALASGAASDAAVRDALLCDFNTPPFKKEPDDWIQPVLTYLKGRI